MRKRSRLAPARPPARNPDRIDFKIRPDGKTVVQKFWTLNGRHKCLSQDVKGEDFDLYAAGRWLKQHGYEFLMWDGTDDPNFPMLWPGARALRELRPIRTRGEMAQYRQQLETATTRFLEEHPRWHSSYWMNHDLAYFL